MRALSEAVRRTMARPKLLAALVGVHVAIALLASGPLHATLAPLLDHRPAAARLLGGDDGLYGELFGDHPEILRVAGASAQGAALLYGLLAWILAGGVLAALAGDDPAVGTVAVTAACARRAGRMVRVGLGGLIVRVAPILVAVGVGFAADKWLTGGGFARQVLVGVAVLVVAGGAWSFATVAIDYARALAFFDETVKPWRCVWRGFKLALRRAPETALYAAFSGLGFALSTALYLAVALALPNEPTWAAALLMVLRLALAFARAFFTVATLTAAALAARAIASARTADALTAEDAR
jgi:hypothetical protein